MPRKSASSRSPQELPWTAARCLRLLRPLTTRLNALRILEEELEISGDQPQRTSPLKRKSRSGNGPDIQDSEWGCGQTRKKVKRTYGGRQTIQETKSAKPTGSSQHGVSNPPDTELGSFTVPTPFLRKQLDFATSSDMSTAHFSMIQESMPPPPTTSADKRRETLCEQVCKDFKNVIVSTVVDAGVITRPSTGATSLFNLCLRNIPAYIANEEEWQEEDEDEEDNHILNETYNYLETLGSSSEAGWKHLRLVAQAHAVHYIRGAIEQQYIHDPRTLEALVSICWTWNMHKEAKSLLESAIHAREQFPHPALSKSTTAEASCFRPSMTAQAIASRTRNDPHQLLRLLDGRVSSLWGHENYASQTFLPTAMLKQGKLSAEWLSCPHFRNLWPGVMLALSEDYSSYHQALDFTYHYLLSISNLQQQVSLSMIPSNSQAYRSSMIQKASLCTLNSLCTMMAALILSEQVDENHAQSSRRVMMPLRLAALDIRTSEGAIDDIDEQHILARILILTTDIVISFATAFPEASEDNVSAPFQFCLLVDYISNLAMREDCENLAVEHIADLLCGISHMYARATSTDALTFLKTLLDGFLSHPQLHKRTTKHLTRHLKRIALDTAMAFALRNPSTESEAYVQTLEASISQPSKTKATPNHRLLASSPATAGRPGFRWEQGICEWVTATPTSLAMLRFAAPSTKPGQDAIFSETPIPSKIAACDASIEHPLATEETPCHQASRGRQPFVSGTFIGVVIPYREASSPTQPGLALAKPVIEEDEEEETSFNDSGIFLDPADSKESMQISQLEEASHTRITRNTRPAKGHPSPPKPSSQPRRSSRKRSLPTTRSPRRLRHKTIAKVVQQEQDDSEDELSINESDCCAGSAEAGLGRRSQALLEGAQIGRRGQLIDDSGSRRRRGRGRS